MRLVGVTLLAFVASGCAPTVNYPCTQNCEPSQGEVWSSVLSSSKQASLSAAAKACGLPANTPADVIDFKRGVALYDHRSYRFTCPESEKDTQ